MAKLSFKVGSTSQTVNLFIQDSTSTTGAGKTGLAFNTASLTAYYMLPRAAAAAITLATQTVTGAWSSGGFVEIDATNAPGWYRFDIPNAALASGVFSSIHFKGATGMAPLPLEIELTAWDNQNAISGGITALAGMNTGTAQGGAASSITLASTASATNGLYDPGIVILLSGTGAGQARNILDYVGSTKVATIDKQWRTNPDSTTVYMVVASQYSPSVNEGLAVGGGATTITLNSNASSTDNVYNGQWVFIRSGTGSDQARMVLSYVGATKVATVSHAWQTNPDATSVYSMMPAARVQGVEGLTASNLDVAVSTLATATNLAVVAGYIDTEVAAIKAKTDNLPASPAAVGSAMTLTAAYDAAKTAAQAGDAMTLTAAYNFAKGTVAMTEGYAADGATATPSEMMYMLWSLMAEKSIAGTTLTSKKLDGSTSAMTFTLNDATSPTGITRAT